MKHLLFLAISSSILLTLPGCKGDKLVEVVVASSVLTNSQLKVARQCKVVIIEGKVSIPKLNTENYEEVKRAFQLED